MVEQRAIDALVRDVYAGAISRRTLLKRGAALGLAAPTLMALMAACGDDDDPTATTAPAQPDPTATSAPDDEDDEEEETPEEEEEEEEEETPEEEEEEEEPEDEDDGPPAVVPTGEIVIMQGVDSNNLDPLLRNSVPEFTVNLHVFDMMLFRDDATLQAEPNIIESWEIVDELIWEFKLVEGAMFHDGTPVNSEAAVFTFERATLPTIGELPRVNQLTNLIGFESVEAIDDYTFRVHTNKPAAIFPDLLTGFEIVPPSVYGDVSPEAIARNAQNPVGSGPYKFVEWLRDDRVVLEANLDYWGGPPAINRVVIRPVPELSARVVALQNEEAHVIVNVAPEVVPQVEAGSNTRISSVVGGRNIFCGIRCDRPPFDDVRVRQALNYAIDWESIRIAILDGYGERTKTIVNPPHDNPNIEAYPYDPDKARELLAEAGVAEGHSIIMNAPHGRYIKDSDIAQVVAQNIREVGFDVDLQVLDWSIYAGELLPSGNPDEIFFLGLGSPFTGEGELFYVHPDMSLNFTYWQDEEFVEGFAVLNRTVDPDERLAIMYDLQVIVQRECPWIFLWHQVDFYGANANLNWEARADERIWIGNSSYTI